ncbi:glycoside hydrolase domain-containing protein [Candidatus Poribacteria bacterium]
MIASGWNMLYCITVMMSAAMSAFSVESHVPLMPQPPTLDGKVDAEEWANAAGFDGFAWQGQLERRRIRSFVGATDDYLCFAFVSQLPEEGQLMAQIQKDTLKLVYDDSVEIWIDPEPGSEHGRTFQMLANSSGHQGYKMHARGNLQADPAWRGNWQIANGFHEGYWHCEVMVPMEDIAPGRAVDEGVWGINLCRNWKQPWAFSSLGGGAYAPENTRFAFVRDTVPTINHEHRTDPATGDINSVFILSNPTQKPLSVQTEMILKRDLMPEASKKETLSLESGESREIALRLKDEATRKFDLTLRAASPDGRTYYSRSYRWEAGPPWQWRVAEKVQLPLDFQFAYYPYLNQMRILMDVTGLPGDAELDHISAVIRQKGSDEAIKTVNFDQFSNGQQEQSFRLPSLEGEYEIAVTAVGRNVPDGELVKTFQRPRYEWEHNQMGRSKQVYAPFTPLQVEGKKVSAVLREHEMNDQGLWDQVIAREKALLAAPMHFRVVCEGEEKLIEADSLSFVRAEAHEVSAESRFNAGPLSAKVSSNWDYDGMMLVELTLLPANGKTIDALTLEIPLLNSAVPLLHAMGDGIRNTLYQSVPKGEGIVWTSEKTQANNLPRNFCSYIYLGSPVRGLCWFAENDLGWSWDRDRSNIELVRSRDTLILRMNLINKPVVIGKERKITFGIQAAPVKPRLGNWRHKYWRDRYTLLGTDINWLALGNCGSVYPAGKDMYLWEMLKRGSRERLSDDEIRQVVEHGGKYFEPYGEDYLERFDRHVRYNLRSRYDKRMIFYYNRASYQAADEFQTFQDEWSLKDYRTVGPGKGVGEIKIVPSESYIDHALYWYDKSFDVGGNQGVYWDNWFFVGSYNTMMTDAYQQADSTVIPSNGIWGLRELSKRTFQYMNETGMLPITMPHMTSTNILPMHSFATVQYDWEWKYSEGDCQYRFPREYILLVSNGELAGTWPVLLGDHGPLASDPWTQRTFAAVCLVHEMIPSGGLREVWDPLLEPIFKLLDDEALEVYRYWDERPLPVVTDNPDLPTIVYSIPGREAVFVVTSYVEADAQATVNIDFRTLGFSESYSLVDVESGEDIQVQHHKFSFPLKKHDVREFRILPVMEKE